MRVAGPQICLTTMSRQLTKSENILTAPSAEFQTALRKFLTTHQYVAKRSGSDISAINTGNARETSHWCVQFPLRRHSPYVFLKGAEILARDQKKGFVPRSSVGESGRLLSAHAELTRSICGKQNGNTAAT